MGTPTNRNFNPFQDVIGTHYEPYIGRFTYLNNQYEVELVKLQIDQELRDRKKIKEVAHQFTSLFIG